MRNAECSLLGTGFGEGSEDCGVTDCDPLRSVGR